MKCCGSGISLSWRTSADCRIDPPEKHQKESKEEKAYGEDFAADRFRQRPDPGGRSPDWNPVLNLPVSVEGKEYTDRVDLTPDEMYQILNTCKELPTTAHLNMVDFAEAFQKAAEEGYTDIVYMGLNSHGSATYQSALLGKKLFYEHLPQYADVKIHLLGSLSYSYGYGYPLVLAAARRDQGATASELVDFIQDFLRHRELYFAMYTLQFAKRSGRIGAAASFVGEMLGLKPGDDL